MEDKKHAREIISNLGFDKLNEMQSLAGKEILKEDAVLLLSPTGSGKTLAFLLPVFEMLKTEVGKVQCLILVPSREKYGDGF
jgi:superfamily II DNA/RNA helicase